MMRVFRYLALLVLLTQVVVSCSLPPEAPITLDELMKTRIYNKYEIKESPEEILHALNTDGEAIIEGKRKIRGKDFPVYIKILATSEGLDVGDYDR